jgi:L-alanine-DL-glutamate epimerase-like enolase superfamily enzyme
VQITDIETIRFETETQPTESDRKGHAHPGEGEPVGTERTITRIVTDDGPDGYAPGGSEGENDWMAEFLDGKEPLAREAIWKDIATHRSTSYRRGPLPGIDHALWDLAGRHADLPVYRLLGGERDRIPCYASTMCGDDDPGGLGTPEAYADFAEELVAAGYPAIKLHGWMPPYDASPERVIAACRAVRDRVGPDIELMLDAHHFYPREEARRIGEALADLDYLWYEEPMNEQSMAAYQWLTEELSIPILGPETLRGNMQTRADWITNRAMDICRTSCGNGGGITGAMKTIHLCEAFEMSCEAHGGSAPNLHVMGAMSIPGRYCERGLLHPDHDFDWTPPHLNSPTDELNDDGTVTVPQDPGLGIDYDWDYIEANRVPAGS